MITWERVWSLITATLQTLTFSPFTASETQQSPFGVSRVSPQITYSKNTEGISFHPPGSATPGFQCHYPSMVGWSSCHASDNTSCWLRRNDGEKQFDIFTDYETETPIGVDRYYYLELEDFEINVDGLSRYAKVFNRSLPGPLIEACWGDRIHINVTNRLKWNGTSLHAHGIRQHHNLHMDGVGGITQCPIAPGDSFQYIWNATQYGSSWAHSHYSVQSGDGAQVPLTIHGPASGNYDAAIEPLIMQDWIHNSMYELVYDVSHQQVPSILLNGRGNLTRFNGLSVNQVPEVYNITFESLLSETKSSPKRYLLRIMNLSNDVGFVFSIDNHYLQIVQADFVPIHPYWNTSVFFAIGQRYNVIVEAKPHTLGSINPIPADGNFWIRTIFPNDCAKFKPDVIEGYERAGILRYNSSSIAHPSSHIWPEINLEAACVDEHSGRLKPMVPWTVGHAANGGSDKVGDVFITSIISKYQSPYALSWFLFEALNSSRQHPANTPFRADFRNPTILNLETENDNWPIGQWIVPENYGPKDWVYLIFYANEAGKGGPAKEDLTNHHPIHLHGHDFAILQQAYTEYHPSKLNLTLENPPRRDTILLDINGFIVIAFKTDNPGAWLLHCHIPLHAAGGMGMQILERQSDLNALYEDGNSAVLSEARRVCANWNSWTYDCRNLWPGNIGIDTTPEYPSCRDMTMLQNDSGV